MTETEQRLNELENQIKGLQSLSGGMLKLLFLSLAYHTQNGSLTKAQKEKLRENADNFFEKNQEAISEIFQQMFEHEMTALHDIIASMLR